MVDKKQRHLPRPTPETLHSGMARDPVNFASRNVMTVVRSIFRRGRFVLSAATETCQSSPPAGEQPCTVM